MGYKLVTAAWLSPETQPDEDCVDGFVKAVAQGSIAAVVVDAAGAARAYETIRSHRMFRPEVAASVVSAFSAYPLLLPKPAEGVQQEIQLSHSQRRDWFRDSMR
jgi:hypothetical protein